ncbi:short-chain dehydrogenase [Saccharospirillum sp. MSK14-1]|uniref:oxidoreductase n=1 Tax=Saccharospirillum sp. MSK14-1 TaxID=1897632 RepID=UPI000D3C0645|nr:oxidoreductase [Saccharospirillum sp. MSK14-1]PTY35872.1 short-chain dehydrogenase [Saccharospirillum sp. MSK14-1]
MVFHLDAVTDLSDTVVIVTGANAGLGLATARALAAKGTRVVMACRNADKAEAARQQLLSAYPQARLDVLPLDLSRLSSVREFAEVFLANYGRLDALINNAGVMFPPFVVTEDGLELQMATNYFGHFLLTGLLLPRLELTPGARVVSLSSVAHRRGAIDIDDLNSRQRYSRVAAYAQSKLACLMFAFELQRRLDDAGYQTISVAAHPGASNTELSRYLPTWLMKLVGPVFLQSAQAGAEPTLYAALGGDIKGGDFTGPRGFRELRGRAIKVGCARQARDADVARQLWQQSEQLTGFRWLSGDA